MRRTQSIRQLTLADAEKRWNLRSGGVAEHGNLEGKGEAVVEKAENLLGHVLHRGNLYGAFEQVAGNKGAHGIDGLSIEDVSANLLENVEILRDSVRNGTYRPLPVRRVRIPKRGGGTRNLGIPTVQDRWLQQAVAQVIGPQVEAVLSDHSFGFRPGRNAHQALERAARYYDEGYRWVVDIDLQSYFDTLNHDLLLNMVREVIADESVTRLIHQFLKAGVMDGKALIATKEGSPQGGNLSPLLSNLYLTRFDRELERRGLRFVRYADDINIYTKSKRAARRVMRSSTRYLEKRLKLTVNQAKSKVGDPTELKFLGFTLGHPEADRKRWAKQKKHKRRKPKRAGKVGLGARSKAPTRTTSSAKKVARPKGGGSKPIRVTPQGEKTTIRIHPKSQEHFKNEVRRRTGRHQGRKRTEILKDLGEYTNGWLGYYARADMRKWVEGVDGWIRRRVRAIMLTQWKTPACVYKNLRKLGANPKWAKIVAGNSRGMWRNAGKPANKCLQNEHLVQMGYESLLTRYEILHNNW